MRVGVFVNQGVDELRRWCDRVPSTRYSCTATRPTRSSSRPSASDQGAVAERPGDEQVFERLPAGVVVLVDRYDP